MLNLAHGMKFASSFHSDSVRVQFDREESCLGMHGLITFAGIIVVDCCGTRKKIVSDTRKKTEKRSFMFFHYHWKKDTVIIIIIIKEEEKTKVIEGANQRCREIRLRESFRTETAGRAPPPRQRRGTISEWGVFVRLLPIPLSPLSESNCSSKISLGGYQFCLFIGICVFVLFRLFIYLFVFCLG